jgi:chemotaxis protein histidine kinase CheA
VPNLPPEVLGRFRVVSLERLDRIDAAWQALIAGSASAVDGETLTQELHTLKGDARVVGMSDVGVLCQRLEELVFAARDRRFHVHEDVDIVMTMAIQFLGMLIRKKPGMVSSGIDLEGFLKQLEAVRLEWLRRSSSIPAADASASARRLRSSAPVIAPPDTRERLASLATDVYLEHLRATVGARRCSR